ncbi:hypothetical protein DIS24_g758 [Lasiodiplodia hormozganensis]|uniref:Uncharacterized protein n=1 Tax=Lasiodiplodia hormozganensis TaxID=869390 RepID=A0AA39Z5A1_9PEZI|nr:hypothetical protein DIS24_g758 [Lasiodiplodia hormozganensis]
MGPWFRLKCCLLLSVHYSTVKEARDLLDEAQLLYDILSSLPQEKLMESIREKLLNAPDDLRRARKWITQQPRALRNADWAERGLTPATDADESGSDTSSDEDYFDVFLTKLDNAEQSAPAEQPEPAGEPSAEKDEATRLIPAS